MAISLSSCAYNVTKVTPHFIDTVHQTCRKYVAIETKPKIIFKFDSEKPLADCNGFISVPLEQGQDMKRYYEEWAIKHNKSPFVPATSKPINSSVDEELSILNESTLSL